MAIYCLCADNEQAGDYSRDNYKLQDHKTPFDRISLQTPMICIKTGAQTFCYDGAQQQPAHHNVDVFECKRCGRKVAK